MLKVTVFCVLILTLAALCSGEGFGECKPCLKNVLPLMRTVQNVVRGLENKDGEMVLQGDDVKPCQVVRIKNMKSVNISSEKPPCSRPCKEGATDCFEQQMPLCIEDYSITCEYDNELQFLSKLIELLIQCGATGICKLPGFNVIPACALGDVSKGIGKAGDAAATGLGKVGNLGGRKRRDLEDAVRKLFKRSEDEEKKEPEKGAFYFQLFGKTGTLDLSMILDWEKEEDPTTLEKCEFSQDSVTDMTFKIGGESVLGIVTTLLTDTLYLKYILGILVKLILKAVIAPIIKNNPQIKDNICTLSCGD